ncbi:MAG: Mur ligase family protein, partial [Sedimenticolaceae bacterium]
MSAISANNSIKLSVLLSGRVTLSEQDDCAISALTLDSRSVVEGTLFLACAGTVRHGMEFFEQAMKNGAAAIVCEPDEQWPGSRIAALAGSISVPLLVMEGLSGQVSAIAGRFYHHPSRSMSVTGITGTNGKTSCAQFLARALSVEATCGVIGTLGNGFPGALDSATHTTPDPVALQALLSDFRVKGASAVAMEVSSHALDQGRAADIRFDAAVFTNLSRDHLDYHGTLEEYGAAK